MKIRPDERPKLIVLAAAVVMVCLYFVSVVIPQITGSGHSSGAPRRPVGALTAASSSAPAVPATPSTAAAPPEASALRDSAGLPAVAVRDPFVPMGPLPGQGHSIIAPAAKPTATVPGSA